MSKHQRVGRLAILVGLLAVTLVLCAVIAAPTGYGDSYYGRVTLKPNWIKVSIGAGVAFVIGSGGVWLAARIIDGFRKESN